jgi:hypothetical protein
LSTGSGRNEATDGIVFEKAFHPLTFLSAHNADLFTQSYFSTMAATKRKLNGEEIITEKFDELGNLTIICKAGSTDDSDAEYHFVVHSVTLRLASPVWRAMLTGT